MLLSMAAGIPLTNKVMVNEDAIIGCVDRIYAALPDEIKHARESWNKAINYWKMLKAKVNGSLPRLKSRLI